MTRGTVHAEISSSHAAWRAVTGRPTVAEGLARTTSIARTARIGLLLLAVFVSAWAAIALVNTPSEIPADLARRRCPRRAAAHLADPDAAVVARLERGTDPPRLPDARLRRTALPLLHCQLRGGLLAGAQPAGARSRRSSRRSCVTRATSRGSSVPSPWVRCSLALGCGLTDWLVRPGEPVARGALRVRRQRRRPDGPAPALPRRRPASRPSPATASGWCRRC